ncbi:MAG: DUF501 domain-containing protein [Actinomycetota bacterium]|nr:DUF501 domain-containing protein [Actinomycetota bacterium]MDA3028183.1 DUF501 domain-containing protein [Actinomycetota bacterium]
MINASDEEQFRVQELLGRQPMGDFAVVARDPNGDPLVIENAPLLADGTPMPTRYWLVGQSATHAVSVLEAHGGVRWAEASIDPKTIEQTHQRHAAARDATIDPDHTGPRPAGGVAGTRTGVKCLHAHYACHLAGEDDPIGQWVAERLSELRVDIESTSTVMMLAGLTDDIPIGIDTIDARLSPSDPPHPADLTNAIGLVTDHLDDLLLRSGLGRGAITSLVISGRHGRSLASLEAGFPADSVVEVDRATVEELFRLLATDDADGRRHNPGPDADDIDALLAVAVIAVACMRRLALDCALLGDDRMRSVRS